MQPNVCVTCVHPCLGGEAAKAFKRKEFASVPLASLPSCSKPGVARIEVWPIHVELLDALCDLLVLVHCLAELQDGKLIPPDSPASARGLRLILQDHVPEGFINKCMPRLPHLLMLTEVKVFNWTRTMLRNLCP